MLDANALAQAFAESLSDALETVGDKAATVTAANAIFRRIMVVFLDGQKYQRPAGTIRSGGSPGQTRNFCALQKFPHVCEGRHTSMAGKYAVSGQATRQLRNIHCVNSCRSSRALSSGLCNKT